MRRLLLFLLLAPLTALFTLDLRRERDDPGPHISAQISGHGPLRAGAGKAEIHVPFPVVPGGYSPRDRHSVSASATPLFARAVTFASGEARLTLVAVDLLEADSRLPADLAPHLPANAGEVWVCATHAHTAMGDYDPNPVAQLAGTGRFHPEARDALLGAIADSVRSAQADLAPAVLSRGRLPISGDLQLVDRSNADDPPEPFAEVLNLRRGDGRTIDLRILGAHPTLVPRGPAQLDGDYPARTTAALDRAPATQAVFLQGAGGNVSVHGSLEAIAARLASPLPTRPLDIDSLVVRRASAPLPTIEIHSGPAWTRKAASNLVSWFGSVPEFAEVGAAHLGPLTLLAVPGEPTAASATVLRSAAFAPDAVVLGLCNGYVGYVETGDRVYAHRGEGFRQLFESSLLARLAGAMGLASRPAGDAALAPVGSATAPRQ